MSAVSFQHVSKIYPSPRGALHALQDVSFDIEPGEFFVLLGPSGSGKTTTLRILAGLEEVSAGRVLMDGVDVGRHCRIRRAIIDKGVAIPPRSIIGYDPEQDRKRFTVTDSGIVVIAKYEHVPNPEGIVCLTSPPFPDPHKA